MATLIPALSTCLKKMTQGEKRFAGRLESKLDDDYLCWYNVPIGRSSRYPDFIILHPQRGIIVLEVKDWRVDYIQDISPTSFKLLINDAVKDEKNPFEQAHEYITEIINILKRDPQLVCAENGKLLFPWTWGVVLTNISRKVFDLHEMDNVIPSHRVICQDEMLDTIDPLAFQEQLWGMFTYHNKGMLTLPQIERVRWHLFPEIRIPYKQASLFDFQDDADITPPDIIKVMDLQQEQLARSLGEGHRVIHGVAGSGKTLILGFRAEYLAQVCSRPILILCYNKVLARRLEEWMESRGLGAKVQVRHFHKWCWDQLKTYHVRIPSNCASEEDFSDELVDAVIRAVDSKHIPAGQCDAVLIDEGHDFRPEWLKLIVQMVNPRSNSLLVLYDDAQSIYNKKKRGFSFKSVDIQATGRTTILKVNYRNTKEILDCATRFAQGLLIAQDSDDDSIPRIAPISGGESGEKPILIKLPTLRDEVDYIVAKLKEAHQQGHKWKDMAVLFRHWKPMGEDLRKALYEARIPFGGKETILFGDKAKRVSLLSYNSSKGLEFPLVAIPGVCFPSEESKADEAEAQLLYVAMTRATKQLIMTGV
ncbi:DEAD/DEAH box helicase [Oryzomonas rubra]|uniref:DNA helicase II n=1 Tax=Oryzomonas rubra TaxID=2509454 RepID=A0A5A9XPM0_9BACT|nr:3'-5' exonuclease [Oryzomonas rubra]KAA0893999.1 DNA helicase II [Oryzomonas rubra]